MNRLEIEMIRLLNQFETALQAEAATWTSWPPALVEASHHVLFGGGKRIRPVVGLLVAEATGNSSVSALPWTIAVELIHTYSLVHDDLPAMDDDDMRRGRPTCHVKFGEAMAILAGDALLTEAFHVLTKTSEWSAPQRTQLLKLLAQSAGGGGMVGGQVLDISGELRELPTVLHMQALKTGALIRAAAKGAAIASGSDAKTIQAADDYGCALGLLFQLTDDLLDRHEDLETGGNNVLHHIDERAVHQRIEEVAQDARVALNGFPANTSDLELLVERIVSRTV